MQPGEKRLQDRGLRFVVAAASLIVVVAGLRQAGPLVLPFLSAVFVAVISMPFMSWLQRKRVPTAIAVIFTVAAAAGVVSVLGVLVGQSVGEFAQVVSESEYNERFEAQANRIRAWADEFNLPVADWTPLDYINPEAVFNLLGGALGALAGILQDAFLVLLAVIFILVEAAGFRAKLQVAFGDRGVRLERLNKMVLQIQKYLAVKTVTSLATGTFACVWVWALGIDFPLMWGLVAFMFNYIPNFGSIVAAIGPVLFALVQFDLGRAIFVALGYVIINVAFGNLLEPTLLGRRLGLSVLVVFLSLVFWGWVWGPMGMLLAVPITMALKIALENSEGLSWIAVLLDANPTKGGAIGRVPSVSPAATESPSDVRRGPRAPTRTHAV